MCRLNLSVLFMLIFPPFPLQTSASPLARCLLPKWVGFSFMLKVIVVRCQCPLWHRKRTTDVNCALLPELCGKIDILFYSMLLLALFFLMEQWEETFRTRSRYQLVVLDEGSSWEGRLEPSQWSQSRTGWLAALQTLTSIRATAHLTTRGAAVSRPDCSNTALQFSTK